MKSNINKLLISAASVAGVMSFSAFAEGEAPAGGFVAQYGTIIWLVVMLAVFYFLLIRPQKKREKEERQLRNALQPGDDIVTIGGFVGHVINVKDDEVTFETGAAKTRLTVKKWAIQSREGAAAKAPAKEVAEASAEENK